MSHPAPSRPPAPANPTRQQLDELDALLERMLALPVNQLEEALDLTRNVPSAMVTLQAPEPAADGPVARLFDAPFTEVPATPEGAATVHMAVAETPSRVDPVIEAAPAETTAAWIPVQEASPAESSEGPAQTSPASEPITDQPVEQLPAEIISVNPARPGSLATPAAETRPSSAEEPVARHAGVAGFILPLVWVNRAFDLAVGRVGPAGRFLHGIPGRSLLGWTGLALLAAAAAWGLLDWVGWTR